MRVPALTCWLIVGAMVAAADATIPDVSSYTRPIANIVFDENFNSDTGRWKKPEKPSFAVQPHVGETGSPGLIATSAGKENMDSWEIPVQVTPGMAYRVSFHYRLDSLKTKDNSRRPHVIVCSLHNLKDKDTGAVLKENNFWVSAENTNGEMRFYSSTVVIPPNARKEATFSIHVDWWYNGTFVYDNFLIESMEVPAELQLAYPDRMTMDEQGKISVRYQRQGEKAPAGAEMLIAVDNEKKLACFGNGVFTVFFGKLPGEKLKLNAVLFNRSEHRILAEHEWELNNLPATPISYLDEHHRLIFNGNPFMPLGVTTMMHMNDEHFTRLQEAGFNTIQVAPMQRHANIQRLPATENTSENLLSYIDYADRFGLKTLMFLPLMIPEKEFIRRKMERAFNGEESTEGSVREIGKTLHGKTNVVGYYLADENIARDLPSTQILRQRVNFADPTHVTTTLTNSTALLDQYVCSGDILLYDCYPYNSHRTPGVKGDLVGADQAFAKIAALHTPFWLVPQGFDWARHPDRQMFGKTSEEKRAHRPPSAEELTALPLLGAIYGAKGFIFYSYHEIFHHGEKVQPGFGKFFWPRIAQAASVLKRMEPFILSTEQADQCKLEVTEGALRSRIFTANGKTAVVLVALKDAPNAATGVLSAGKHFTSLYGRTTINGNAFSFSSSGVNYDVLLGQ